MTYHLRVMFALFAMKVDIGETSNCFSI